MENIFLELSIKNILEKFSGMENFMIHSGFFFFFFFWKITFRNVTLPRRQLSRIRCQVPFIIKYFLVDLIVSMCNMNDQLKFKTCLIHSRMKERRDTYVETRVGSKSSIFFSFLIYVFFFSCFFVHQQPGKRRRIKNELQR